MRSSSVARRRLPDVLHVVRAVAANVADHPIELGASSEVRLVGIVECGSRLADRVDSSRQASVAIAGLLGRGRWCGGSQDVVRQLAVVELDLGPQQAAGQRLDLVDALLDVVGELSRQGVEQLVGVVGQELVVDGHLGRHVPGSQQHRPDVVELEGDEVLAEELVVEVVGGDLLVGVFHEVLGLELLLDLALLTDLHLAALVVGHRRLERRLGDRRLRGPAHAAEVEAGGLGDLDAPDEDVERPAPAERHVELRGALAQQLGGLLARLAEILLTGSGELGRRRRLGRRLHERALPDPRLLRRHQVLVTDEFALDVALGNPVLTEDDEQPEALAALLPLLCPQRQQLADAVEEAGQHGHRVVDLRLRELLEVGRELAPSPVERLDGRTHVLSGTDQPGEHPVELAAEVLEVSAEVAALILGIDPRTAVLGSRVADRVAVDRQVGGRLRRLGAVDAIFLVLGERRNRGRARSSGHAGSPADRLRTAARGAAGGGRRRGRERRTRRIDGARPVRLTTRSCRRPS